MFAGNGSQRLADSALLQVANCYRHQAHRLINTYFSQREHLDSYQELTRRVMALGPVHFSLHREDAGGDGDIYSLSRLCDKSADFLPEVARSVLESQLLRLENRGQATPQLALPHPTVLDYASSSQPDLGEIDKLIKQILAMEVPMSTFPPLRSGHTD